MNHIYSLALPADSLVNRSESIGEHAGTLLDDSVQLVAHFCSRIFSTSPVCSETYLQAARC